MRTLAPSLLLVLALGRTANAAEFDITGQTCVPSASSIALDNFTTQLGGDVGVGWLSSNTGTITLYCAIPYLASPSHLEIYYKSNTGCMGCGSDSITVTYVKMSKTTGALTSIGQLNTSGGVNDGTYRAVSTPFSDNWDNSAYVYYLRIDMTRANTSNSQEWMESVVY